MTVVNLKTKTVRAKNIYALRGEINQRLDRITKLQEQLALEEKLLVDYLKQCRKEGFIDDVLE